MISSLLALACLLGASTARAAQPAAVPITLLHTNDLHSHFRGENTPLGLGGLARIKTAVDQVRAQTPNTLLVDGGDWSEGNIYYTEGAGRETVRMMDSIGYDVAVVGNHDWLNGADVLLDMLEQANPAMKLVASNIATGKFARQDEFLRRIPPYVIEEVGGVKIAFIGLLTYEFVYDSYLAPIKITEPFAAARELAKELKKQADAVVVISHNSIKLNQGVLAAAPDVDLLIGAHDHVKLTRPVIVNRPGAKPAWIVETGCWGRYLGRVDMKVTPRDPSDPKSRGSVELVSYRLRQMDATVAEDPKTLARIASLEALIEARRGAIFHDHVGDSQLELSRDGQENLMGDFATDAYLAATQADLAIDQTNFIYNEIHEGAVRTVDVFNSNPGVYDPRTNKAWTLHLLPIQGKTLSWILNLLYTSKSMSQSGALNFSGVDMVYGPRLSSAGGQPASLLPSLAPRAPFASDDLAGSGISISQFKIRGQDLQGDRTYIAAISGGVLQALQFLHGLLPGAVPLDQMRDSGQEDWRIMADYLAAHSPIQSQTIPFGRVHTTQADLGVLYDDIRWEPLGWEPATASAPARVSARIRVRVRNTGMKPSPAGSAQAGPRLTVLINEHGTDYSVDPSYRDGAQALGLPELDPGQGAELVWDQVLIPESLGVYAVTARIVGNDSEIDHANDEATRYFANVPPGLPRPTTLQ